MGGVRGKRAPKRPIIHPPVRVLLCMRPRRSAPPLGMGTTSNK